MFIFNFYLSNYSAKVMSESTWIFFNILGLLILFKGISYDYKNKDVWYRSIRWYLFSGFIFGLASLTRAIQLIYVAGIIGGLFILIIKDHKIWFPYRFINIILLLFSFYLTGNLYQWYKTYNNVGPSFENYYGIQNILNGMDYSLNGILSNKKIDERGNHIKTGNSVELDYATIKKKYKKDIRLIFLSFNKGFLIFVFLGLIMSMIYGRHNPYVLLLVLSIIPVTLVLPIFYAVPRYGFGLYPSIFLIIGFGIETLYLNHFKNNYVAILILFFIPASIQGLKYIKNVHSHWEPNYSEYEIAGQYLSKHFSEGKIIDKEYQISFYTGWGKYYADTFVMTPEEPLDRILLFAKINNIKYLVVDHKRTIKVYLPQLEYLMDESFSHTQLELIYEDSKKRSSDQNHIKIFKIKHQ